MKRIRIVLVLLCGLMAPFAVQPMEALGKIADEADDENIKLQIKPQVLIKNFY